MSGQGIATDARADAGELIRGLYAITPEVADTGELVGLVAAALRGGASVVQYRAKFADAALKREQGRALSALCRQFEVPLIINDDWRLALDVDAAGVHIGANDGDPVAVRAAIGPGKILGVSCYHRLELAERVIAMADYVAFGSVFPSRTKPAAVRADLGLFREVRRRGWRSVAIGGIDAGNAHAVIEAGADAVAVISAVFGVEDVEGAARGISGLFRVGL
jgi:thiamine-phosphate pyrophosphorylase